MYDEPVKSLRKLCEMTAHCDDYRCFECPCEEECSSYKNGRLSAVYKQAADAIEELQQTVEHYKGCADDWYKEACDYKAQMPRWIPVSERKPKTDDIVIVAIHDDSGDTPYDATNVGFYLDVFPLGIWVVENERCNYVTHWMPLPEPPKGE